jgi:hypothetical protein
VLLMGSDGRTGELTELGGGFERDIDSNPFSGAVREMMEETLGLIDIRSDADRLHLMANPVYDEGSNAVDFFLPFHGISSEFKIDPEQLIINFKHRHHPSI